MDGVVSYTVRTLLDEEPSDRWILTLQLILDLLLCVLVAAHVCGLQYYY